MSELFYKVRMMDAMQNGVNAILDNKGVFLSGVTVCLLVDCIRKHQAKKRIVKDINEMVEMMDNMM